MWCEGYCGLLVNFFAFIVIFLGFHYVYLLWNSDYWKKRGVFCPDSKALLGNLPGQVNGKRHIFYELDDLYKEHKDQFPYIGIYQFRQPRLLLLDPEVIKDILIKYFKNFQGTEMHGMFDKEKDPLFGNHPFALVGDEWKTKRAEMTPAFTNNRIKAIFPVAQNTCERMVKFIKQEAAKDDFDGIEAKDLATRFTISIVSNSIYNVDPRSFEGEESDILKTGQEIMSPTKRFMIFFMLQTMYPFLKPFMKMGFAKPGSINFFIDLMASAMKHREANNIQSSDYLEYLMNLKKKKEISDIDIAGQGASFLIDGYETSSSAISSTLKLLGENIDVQNKLRDEINKAMPNDEDFTYDNICALPYLDQVWNETLRIHSPGSHLSRMCNVPVEVDLPKDKKLFFEKGLIILIPIISIHMDPEYYPDPTKFDPERFSPENGGVKSHIDRGIFLPFGAGPRICPGNRFAVSQSKIAIATIIKNFEVSINPKSPKEYLIHPQALVVTYLGCYLNFKEVRKH